MRESKDGNIQDAEFAQLTDHDGESDMRDIIALFNVEERRGARARTERMIAAVQALGGDGQAYKRERARAAKAIVAEVYSPPRVTAAARRLPRYGLEPGLALDITVDDETGRPYDFNRREQRQKAEAKIDAQRPLLLIGSPMCTALSAIQAINRERRDP